MLPYLQRFTGAGTDRLLEILCYIAAQINTPAIDSILERLFLRWIRRFKRGTRELQHGENHTLWAAFRLLSHHPRFKDLPAFALRLLDILELSLTDWHRAEVLKVLEDQPCAWYKFENLLLRATPYEHFRYDDVDRFDDVADSLFRRPGAD